ncbi:MAG: ABC transporter ATP-binding protein [Aureliella sp.]
MKNFTRALKQASRYWPSLILGTACSFIVAGLWGANIGAFFPILEVTIQGRSAQEWVATELEQNKTKLVELEQSLGAEQAAGASEIVISGLKKEVDLHRAQVSSYTKLKPWVDNYVPNDPFQTIGIIVGMLIVSTLVKHVFLISNEVIVGRVALNVTAGMRNQIFRKALSLDRVTFAQYGHANFVTSVIHTTDMLSTGLINMLGAALREPLKIIACLVGACFICWRLLILSCLVAPLVGLLLYFVTKSLKAASTRVLQRAGGFHGVLLESLNNIQTVQAFRREDSEQARFEDATAMMKRFGLRFIFVGSLSKPIIEFLGIGMLGTTIVAGSYLVLNEQTSIAGIRISDQQLSVSALFVFFGMLIGISDPLRKLSAVYSSVYSGAIAADALFPLLDQPSLINDPETPVDVERPHQSLEISELGFHYTPDQPVLEHISLSISHGRTIGIIGANGSGKSTLINLLCRFYDPSQGAIRLNGTDYRELAVDDIRSRIALVNQSTELFNESVAYNIRYGRPDATDDEVLAVSKAAHAHEFISTVLEDGYETNVGQNGSRLSGGQRQRIALARALLCDPEILILDEATSQIDMKSEQLIRESLEEHLGERTLIIITHREKLLELADEVYQLENGRLTDVDWRRNAAA